MPGRKLEAEKELFYEYLRQNGLKKTRQKDLILDTFLGNEGHMSVEDIYALVKKRDRRVGIVTVFRTLKSLNACGIAREINLGDGLTQIRTLLSTSCAPSHYLHQVPQSDRVPVSRARKGSAGGGQQISIPAFAPAHPDLRIMRGLPRESSCPDRSAAGYGKDLRTGRPPHGHCHATAGL